MPPKKPKNVLHELEVSLQDAAEAYGALRELASRTSTREGFGLELAIALEAKTASERAGSGYKKLLALVAPVRDGQSAFARMEGALNDIAVSAQSSSNVVTLALLGAMERSPSTSSSQLLKLQTCGFCKRILKSGERRVAGLNAIICEECLRRIGRSPVREIRTGRCAICGRERKVSYIKNNGICKTCIGRVSKILDPTK